MRNYHLERLGIFNWYNFHKIMSERLYHQPMRAGGLSFLWNIATENNAGDYNPLLMAYAKNSCDGKNHENLVLMDHNKEVLGGFTISTLKYRPLTGHISNFAVAVSGKGHGRILLTKAFEHAKSMDYNKLCLTAAKQDKYHPVGFYIACGFRKEIWDHNFLEEAKNHHPDGTPIQMVKEL